VPRLEILVSAVLVLSCEQTDRITDADDRYTRATTVSVSKYSTERSSFRVYFPRLLQYRVAQKKRGQPISLQIF